MYLYCPTSFTVQRSVPLTVKCNLCFLWFDCFAFANFKCWFEIYLRVQTNRTNQNKHITLSANQVQTKIKRKLGSRIFPRLAPVARVTGSSHWFLATLGALWLVRCVCFGFGRCCSITWILGALDAVERNFPTILQERWTFPQKESFLQQVVYIKKAIRSFPVCMVAFSTRL